MSDYSELKRLLEGCKESNCADASDFGRRIAELYDYLDPETVAEMVAEAERLKADNEALRKIHESLRPLLKLTEIPREGASSELDLLRKDAEAYRRMADRFKESP